MWSLLSVDEQDELNYVPDSLRHIVHKRREAAEAAGRELEREIIETRFAWIDGRMHEFLQEKRPDKKPLTERIDTVLLHPITGFSSFLLVMGIVFQALFRLVQSSDRLCRVSDWFAGSQRSGHSS